mmetsp:Transcript_195/g.614  ORF Transcript_195/g.614 Transcript_195/m.614 type:complete len:215 (-) Transcript_195:362-1006(-)
MNAFRRPRGAWTIPGTSSRRRSRGRRERRGDGERDLSWVNNSGYGRLLGFDGDESPSNPHGPSLNPQLPLLPLLPLLNKDYTLLLNIAPSQNSPRSGLFCDTCPDRLPRSNGLKSIVSPLELRSFAAALAKAFLSSRPRFFASPTLSALVFVFPFSVSSASFALLFFQTPPPGSTCLAAFLSSPTTFSTRLSASAAPTPLRDVFCTTRTGSMAP